MRDFGKENIVSIFVVIGWNDYDNYLDVLNIM